MKKGLVLILILIMIGSLTGCVEKGEVSVLYGESTFIFLNKAYDALVWESSDPAIASVQSGVVTGNKPGQVTVTASSAGKVVAEYTVQVEVVEIQKLFLQASELTLEIGQTSQLKYTLFPADASDYGLTYTSINPEIASVDQDGIICGLEAGTTMIVVSAPNGITEACNVTVNEKSAIDQLNEHEKELFEYLIKDMLPNFYDATTARLRNIWYMDSANTGEPIWSILWVEIQGKNKLGGTAYKQYVVMPRSGMYMELEKYITESDTSFIKADTELIDYAKVNAALAEHWEKMGM